MKRRKPVQRCVTCPAQRARTVHPRRTVRQQMLHLMLLTRCREDSPGSLPQNQQEIWVSAPARIEQFLLVQEDKQERTRHQNHPHLLGIGRLLVHVGVREGLVEPPAWLPSSALS